jgi:hypothetical protein
MDDKFIALTQTAQILSAIIGRPETNEFVVVEMPTPDCVTQGLAAQGYRFVGLMGIVDGEGRSAMAESLSSEQIAQLADVFALQVARITAGQEQTRPVPPAPADDFTTFAESLFALPDPRD